MENTSKLTKVAMEKRALIGQKFLSNLAKKEIPLFSGYARNLINKVINPMAEKGVLKTFGSILKDQYIPKSYYSGVSTKAKAMREELSQLNALGSLSKNQATRLNKIKKKLPTLEARAQMFQPGSTPIRSLSQGIIDPRYPLRDKAFIAKELGRYAGQRGLTGLNTALMWGLPPLYIGKQISEAQPGHKLQALGESFGDVAGFSLASPIGILPSVLASYAGSELGGALGGSLSNAFSQESPVGSSLEMKGPLGQETMDGPITNYMDYNPNNYQGFYR